MKLLPSLLYPDFEEMSQRFAECLTVSDEVHIDFADGVFVENLLPDVAAVSSLEGDIEMEAHLMVQQPQSWVTEVLSDDRFRRIIVHAEAEGDIGSMLQQIHAEGRMAGVALRPDTPVGVLLDWAEYIDQVLLLMVDPGFNGSPFQPSAVSKIDEVRLILPQVEVSADGGIRPETLPLVVNAGVDRVAVGSYLHGQPLQSGLDHLRDVYANEVVWGSRESE